MLFVLALLVVALCFEYMNGFNDSANAIATSVATKVLTAKEAIILASICDFVGALAGTAVAKTIAAGLVDVEFVTQPTILCALLAAIFWNLTTWRFGIPSSSSHALIGGLCGATLATAHNQWSVIKWATVDPVTGHHIGLFYKVIFPMFAAPIVGLIAGYLVMGALVWLIKHQHPQHVASRFGKLQIAAAGWTSFSHGMNDAQKTMGIIALSLYTATRAGTLDHLPPFMNFLRNPNFEVPMWVKVLCATTISIGIATGGFRIIRTVGKRLTKLLPAHGFAAQATGAAVIQTATVVGIPLSTTHVISSCIMGVGAAKRFNAVKWSLMGKIVCAWVITLPITGTLGYLIWELVHWIGVK
jgi:PiT family inorganic phosphate transporter